MLRDNIADHEKPDDTVNSIGDHENLVNNIDNDNLISPSKVSLTKSSEAVVESEIKAPDQSVFSTGNYISDAEEEAELAAELEAEAAKEKKKAEKKALKKAGRNRKRRPGEKISPLRKVVLTLIAAVFAISFLLPTILTFANSFMSEQEISSNYGLIFNDYTNKASYSDEERTTTYRSEKVNLKLIPDKVVLSQYVTVLLKSPDYLMKFWNSVFLTLPIMIFQIVVALGASYCFARFRGKIREIIFFLYLILMLMPYQVTLVPNYLVANWLGLLDTRWSIILPGVFAPFSVYLLTKYMRRIPESLIEAAKLDGANEWNIFWKIAIPICKGPIVSVAILVFIDYWNMVEQPLIMLSDSAFHPLSVFLSQINDGEIGLAFAVATIYMVPPILIFLAGEEYLVDGIAYSGSVKG